LNYTTIIQAALDYADKNDTQTSNNMDTFLRVVESRINRLLDVGKMATRSVISTIAGQQYYGLPADFSQLREIRIREDLSTKPSAVLEYVSPVGLQNAIDNGVTTPVYTLIADQLRIYPAQDNQVLEITYLAKVPQLTSKESQNWLSEQAPDAYIFGLLVEINSFIKDGESAAMWDSRFDAVIRELIHDDQIDRWSGPSLTIRAIQ